ncbi:MAG: hypothetical protein ACFB0Z_06880 [Candidatus Phaeomarinobacter sp.]
MTQENTNILVFPGFGKVTFTLNGAGEWVVDNHIEAGDGEGIPKQAKGRKQATVEAAYVAWRSEGEQHD